MVVWHDLRLCHRALNLVNDGVKTMRLLCANARTVCGVLPLRVRVDAESGVQKFGSARLARLCSWCVLEGWSVEVGVCVLLLSGAEVQQGLRGVILVWERILKCCLSVCARVIFLFLI